MAIDLTITNMLFCKYGIAAQVVDSQRFFKYFIYSTGQRREVKAEEILSKLPDIEEEY
jgi:hypothetical protein